MYFKQQSVVRYSVKQDLIDSLMFHLCLLENQLVEFKQELRWELVFVV